MKIHVIGNKGVVGKATYDTLKVSSKYEITGNDFREDCPNGKDVYIFCTPERITEELVWKMINNDGLFVIRSTMRPDIVKNLINKKDDICVNPEFLKANTPFWDCYFTKNILIGAEKKEHFDIVSDIWSFTRMPVFKTGILEASYMKLISNVHASMQITFWNEMQRVADKIGVNIFEVARLLPMLDERVSRYGSFPGQKYSGACLPKDVEQFNRMCAMNGLSSDWFGLMHMINNNYPDGDLVRSSL